MPACMIKHRNSTGVDAMYVCLCTGVTDNQIRDAVREGSTTVRRLRKQLGCTGQCGKCKQQVRELRDEVLIEQRSLLVPALAAT